MTKNIAETEINKKIKTIGKILEEIFGFILLIIMFIGVGYATAKWSNIIIKPNNTGGFTSISENWWGMQKNIQYYSFNTDTKEWEVTEDGVTSSLKLKKEIILEF